MHRIDSSTASADENGPGRAGWTEGVPGVTPPTSGNKAWFNAVQEELSRAVELLGAALDIGNMQQLGELLTTRLLGWATGLGVLSSELAYVNTLGAAAPKVRTVYYDALPAAHSSGWAPSASSHGLVASAASAIARLPLAHLPDGAEISNLRVLVDPGGGALMNAKLQRETVTLATPALGGILLVLDAPSAGTALQWLGGVTGGGAAATVDKAGGKTMSVLVTSAQAGDVFYGVEVTFADPGPRNA